MSNQYGRNPKGWVIGVILVVALLIGGISVGSGYDNTDGGHVGVIRNGGWFDNRQTRDQLVSEGSGNTWIGLFSDLHQYPSNERFYAITTDEKMADRPATDYIKVPSIDGVGMEFEATIFFTLVVDSVTLREFDDKYGTRTFGGKYIWTASGDEDESGWIAFLEQIIAPVIKNAFRQQIGTYKCTELLPTCVYLTLGQQAVVNKDPDKVVDPNKVTTEAGKQAAVNLSKIQEQINTTLGTALNTALGGTYLANIRVNLTRTELPEDLDANIRAAQAAWINAGKAQADVQKATAEASANKARQDGYNLCTTCAQIDIMKAQSEVMKSLPPGITTYAPGANSMLPIK